MQKKERQKKALYKLSAYSRSARVEQERRPGECFLKRVGWGWSGVGVGGWGGLIWEATLSRRKEGWRGVKGEWLLATRGRAFSWNVST